MDRSEMHRVNLFLDAETHAKFKAYAKSQNRSMQKQFEMILANVLAPGRPSPLASVSPLAAKTVATPQLTESNVRAIVRHELSYLMPDQYERRYGKGDPK